MTPCMSDTSMPAYLSIFSVTPPNCPIGLLQENNLKCRIFWDVEDKESLHPLGKEKLTEVIKAAEQLISIFPAASNSCCALPKLISSAKKVYLSSGGDCSSVAGGSYRRSIIKKEKAYVIDTISEVLYQPEGKKVAGGASCRTSRKISDRSMQDPPATPLL